ncbi:DUF6290 family protein [Aquisalimonas sp. APHAB1-3]|uniref:type II toxin-antitoxin system RelB family antitoxin n=1 Tax=Aquisalimonas sp. APHAB1-3 TaxID=3402080 RepID=UPI003AAEA068
MPTTIRLSEDVEQRLTRLARATGRTKAFYLRKLIEEHLDELEDVYLAEQALERVRQGQERTLTHEEFWRDMDD